MVGYIRAHFELTGSPHPGLIFKDQNRCWWGNNRGDEGRLVEGEKRGFEQESSRDFIYE